MEPEINKEIALYSILKKWNKIIRVENHHFLKILKNQVLVINFDGYDIDFFDPRELVNVLSLIHNELRELYGSEIEIKYLKCYPLLDSMD